MGWVGATALAVGGSNQSLFLVGALVISQGTAAVPLLVVGLLLSWAALPGWTELVLMWPDRVGGISATCAEAFRPYSPVLANLAGVSYWWGWVPTCGLTALLSASALHQWYLPGIAVNAIAVAIILLFLAVNLRGLRWVTRLAVPLALVSVLLAFGSAIIPVLSGSVDWHRAASFHLASPFSGAFGAITSAMAGLYLIGFAAPAFEAAACHVGEMRDPARNLPRAMYASAGLASLYFVILPVVWLGVLGPGGLSGELMRTLGPTFAPLLGAGAKSAAIGFLVLNMFHGTLQPLAGASRTLSQLSEDGLLPRLLGRRNKADVPWFATALTAAMAILFLLSGDPTWVIAAANFCYLIAIGLPSIAVWLLRRDAPEMERPYRARRGAVSLGVAAACAWGLSTVLGFQQFGLPSVIAGLGLAYSGSLLYAWRKRSDRRRAGETGLRHSLHMKLAGAMVTVISLDGVGYLLAVNHVDRGQTELVTVLADIFVAVAILTVGVGLVLPGVISHAAGQVAAAADRLARGTLTELTRALEALSRGDLDEAHASVHVEPVRVHSQDEVGAMAESFNVMQQQAGRAAVALSSAREGLKRNVAQQATIARLGLRALESGETDMLIEEIVTSVSSVLDTEIVAVLEHADGTMRVRAASGLPPRHSLTADALPTLACADDPASQDVQMPDLCEDGVARAGVLVSIPGRSGSFGVLCAQTAAVRTFSAQEVDFLRSIANLLGDALARQLAEDEIRHQALHDPLTGLPNRVLFLDRLRVSLAHSARRNSKVAVLFIDLDHFKLVNDSFGHPAGDELLHAVAARLDGRLRAGDTVARFGGDELLMICDDLASADDAQTIADGLRKELLAPFTIAGDTELLVRASIGIAISNGVATDAEELIAEADSAMYRAKEHGGGRTETFNPILRKDARSQLRTEHELAKAIENDQLRLHYQPIIAIDTGRILGLEALVRWQHPERGLVSPGEFIPIAEATGLIVPIGAWVLQRACRQSELWRRGQSPDTAPTMAVNLSLQQFVDPDLFQVIERALNDSRLDPGALQLEITESVIMRNEQSTLITIAALKRLGVSLVLDDFGTGYSSLSYLQRFPIDVLKIDRSFIAALDDQEHSQAIVAAIINMAQGLNIDVVAEGIETTAQADRLRALGCQRGQGFLYARPLPADEISALLDSTLPNPAPSQRPSTAVPGIPYKAVISGRR
jgi:diguanylate cyclase (GGDEF)-like protein